MTKVMPKKNTAKKTTKTKTPPKKKERFILVNEVDDDCFYFDSEKDLTEFLMDMHRDGDDEYIKNSKIYLVGEAKELSIALQLKIGAMIKLVDL